MTVAVSLQSHQADPDQIVKLLDTQIDLYHRLGELASRQSSLVAEGKVDDLLSILSERSRLIDSLTALNQKIDPVRQNINARWDALSPDDRQRIRGRLDKIQGMVKAILDSDGRDRSALEAARAQVGQEVLQSNHQAMAARAYRSPVQSPQSPTNNRFTDRKG
ncbi:MAG: hypothetical protein GC164_05505 [Phycisphaera sp.]|nr:hypothetical protein [Phycisphaera sp.]